MAPSPEQQVRVLEGRIEWLESIVAGDLGRAAAILDGPVRDIEEHFDLGRAARELRAKAEQLEAMDSDMKVNLAKIEVMRDVLRMMGA